MGQVRGIADEDTRLFAGTLGGGDNDVQAFCKIAGSRRAAMAEFVLKIRGADKKHIHTLGLRDPGGMIDPFWLSTLDSVISGFSLQLSGFPLPPSPLPPFSFFIVHFAFPLPPPPTGSPRWSEKF